MKVALKNVLPNPWRYINKGYPINWQKVENLRQSVRDTTYWDNILGRKREDDKVEIAFGHHRFEALKKEFPLSHEVEIIIRQLDDAMMLKLMANENSTQGVMSPAVINETIRATRDFLKANPEIVHTAAYKLASKSRRNLESHQIAVFLKWPQRRVDEALASIKAMEDGKITKEEYETLASQAVAERFRQAVTAIPLPLEARQRVHQKVITGTIGYRSIRKEVLKERFKPTKQQEKITIDDVAFEVSRQIRGASILFNDDFIANIEYIGTEALNTLSRSINLLLSKLLKVKEKLGSKRQLSLIDMSDHKGGK